MHRRNQFTVFALVVLLCSTWEVLAWEEPKPVDDAAAFANDVQPLLQKYCITCHSTEEQEGELDLEQFKSLAEIRRDLSAWEKVAEMLGNGEMLPKDKPYHAVYQFHVAPSPECLLDYGDDTYQLE